MKRNTLKCIAVISFIITTAASAEDPETKKFGTEFSGYTFIEAGEVMKGKGFQDVYNRRWLEDACIGIFSSTRIDEHLKVLAGFEALLGFPFNIWAYKGETFVPFRQTINSFWVSRGEGIYSFGDPEKTSLQIEAGYFPYKYNNEVRNLGEYLFRTYCYPPTMINQFDRTYTELLGVRIGNTLAGAFHHDLLLYSEVKQYPYNDLSIAYLFDVKIPTFFFIPKFIIFGGGINLYRLVPVRGDLTTPSNSDNPGNRYEHVNTLNVNSNGDTIYDDKFVPYSGTKVMGRATLDFKGFLSEFINGLLGPEDLRLYSEVAVLGWKDYPILYEKRFQRTPFTVGFNLPAFKILDLLNTEIEFLNSPNANSVVGPYFNLLPVPTVLEHEHLKWSVYAKKTIGKRMSISAQAANDHFMPKSLNPAENIQDYTDVTLRHGDWWWNLRVRFDF